MHYVNGTFYIEDAGSKFGTLIETNDMIRLRPYFPYCFQIGKTVITIMVKKPNEHHEEGARKTFGAANPEDVKDSENKLITEKSIDTELNYAHPTDFNMTELRQFI